MILKKKKLLKRTEESIIASERYINKMVNTIITLKAGNHATHLSKHCYYSGNFADTVESCSSVQVTHANSNQIKALLPK